MQRRVRRDGITGSLRAIAKRRRDDELALAANLHAKHALIPSLDDLSRAEGEAERLVAVHGRSVEHSTVVERPRVKHVHRVAVLRHRPRAHDEVP